LAGQSKILYNSCKYIDLLSAQNPGHVQAANCVFFCRIHIRNHSQNPDAKLKTKFLDETKKAPEKTIVVEKADKTRNGFNPGVCGLVNSGPAAPELPQLHPVQGSLGAGHKL
jgi:hypothetical protein